VDDERALRGGVLGTEATKVLPRTPFADEGVPGEAAPLAFDVH
jgi:hypothetical protein